MMTPEEIRARAERAAEWARANLADVEVRMNSRPDCAPDRKWGVFPKGQDLIKSSPGRTDREIIAFCEDRGFRDPIPTEAEAVVWLIQRQGWEISSDQINTWIQRKLVGSDIKWVDLNPVEEALKLGYAVEGEG